MRLQVAFTRSKENPAGVAKLVAEWISPGEVQDEAALGVLHQWVLREPGAALTWAQMSADENVRGPGLNELEILVAKSLE